MDGPGDITDEFDDDALRESIEQAERQGQWRENAAGFVDPKLETLKKQLAEAERTHASYAQRRLRELAQRAAAEPAAPAAVVTTAQPADPFAGDWRAAVAPTAPAPSAPNPGSLPEPKYVASARSVHPMRTTLRPLLSGFGVFLPIAVVQTLLTEWHYDVALRLVVAAPLAGFAWQRVDADRFRAAGIGAGVHLLAFFLTATAWDLRAVIANGTGLALALLGSLVVGSLRESQHLLADRD